MKQTQQRLESRSKTAHASRPAGGDSLQTCAEADTFEAVRVVIAEQGRLPATERVERDGCRNWHVDAHHAEFDVVGKTMRCVAVASEDRNAVGLVMQMNQIDCFVVILAADNRQNQAKDFFTPDEH